MKVKIDTKEKFNVLTIMEPFLSANMTAELREQLLSFLDKQIKNLIVKLSGTFDIDEFAANALPDIQQKFYDNNSSFVICELSDSVRQKFIKMELIDMLNITPTESEAWDIVQMEEIEREL